MKKKANHPSIGPIFPLAGDIIQQRRTAKTLIDKADPVTVQIALALLMQIHKQQRLKADYLALCQQAEKELGR